MSTEVPAPAPSGIKFSLRACCLDAPRGAGFVEVRGAPPALTAPDAVTVVEDYHRPDFELDRPTAFHEAGHALVAIVAGGTVRRVTVRDPNPKAACRDVPFNAQPVFALAGPHAENLARGWISPIAQSVVVEHLDIVAAPAGGRCDLCLALRPCVARAGLDNQAEAHRLFREAERRTVDLLDHEMSRRFLRSCAFELLREGELPGERVHEIFHLVVDRKTHETLKQIITLENKNA
ncbi:MAG: hypothetical protein IOC54_15850 [Methylobacterium sp.]|nr:hypothetical protein [Methylobacterium sp.]MCA3646942.1 hypothetical protein [Methylobacterium sp.]MCA3653288.1 hypothetical protein [Methylobacterium sp.]MCA4923629.1 hypothetical protein [Methylobacterium sp.]